MRGISSQSMHRHLLDDSIQLASPQRGKLYYFSIPYNNLHTSFQHITDFASLCSIKCERISCLYLQNNNKSKLHKITNNIDYNPLFLLYIIKTLRHASEKEHAQNEPRMQFLTRQGKPPLQMKRREKRLNGSWFNRYRSPGNLRAPWWISAPSPVWSQTGCSSPMA